MRSVKPEAKTSLGRFRCRWKDSVKIDLKETGMDVVTSIHLALDGGGGGGSRVNGSEL
jgi:hypothetical protein